ncbi:contactin-3-like [Babylonia areolata]|uniref:contactin-3-like n=1 Tax=Babylonia areolata TaxID=304850 RepID=UPI003FD33973
MGYLIFLLCALVVTATAQTLFNCPVHWYQHAGDCFLFEGDSPGTYEQARVACSDHGAALVSVEDRVTHFFLKNWLEKNDPFLRQWYTSGHRERVTSLQESSFMWEGTGSPLSPQLSFWNTQVDSNSSDGVIVYGLGEGGYGWELVKPEEELPYICQVAQTEAYRIVQDDRDYDYGRNVVDFNVLEKGPHFTLQPVSTVVVGDPDLAELECVADANPPPTYRWYRGDSLEEEVTASVDSRYTLTNGKLTIQNPKEEEDSGFYRCTAQNRLGMVISNDVQLSFGDLGEFSNVPDAAVNARAYDGVAIECSKITFKPAVKYAWFKESTDSFIRPNYQTYQFMSQNGKLYFSEVTRADEGRYHCIAILTGVNRYTIGTTQPPTRSSLAIPLVVHDQAPKADWGPEIQDDFIAVFPQPPLKGQDVRMECFAYGSSNTPFHYNWKREGKPIPARARLSEQNRVLTIPDAALEDQGTYTCTVSRSTNARDSKSFYLSLGARPYFISPLRDQHVDVRSQLTWRCDARANPPATYTWYKNGQVVTSDPEQGIRVNGNVMRIDSLDAAKHDGMYQCGAVNTYGMTLSEAELRVLAFAPTFDKHPVRSKIKAALNGNATITCNPEGAPEPLITWFKDGGQLTGDGNHVLVLPNGNLVIQGLQNSDQGRYTCKAENELGEAQSSASLSLASGTTITVGPAATRETVNGTAFFTCQASHDPLLDLVYTWYFNGHFLDTLHRPDLRRVSRGRGGHSGLYIIGVEFHHAGFYECVARTTLSEDRSGAHLTVLGPPSEPTGCFVDDLSVRNGSVEVLWTSGRDNGRAINLYLVQMANGFEEDVWRTVFSELPGRIPTEPDNQKKRAHIRGLSPGNSFRFRVIAHNQFGASVPSVPSSWIYMPSAPPTKVPTGVRGGGGSVGDLTIAWTPLEVYDESGANIGYKVYWKKHGDENALWEWKELKGYNDHYVAYVGGHNYFLEYDAQVQAFNDMGYGPNTSVSVIFSAEDLPRVAVTDVRGDGYNGTANYVTWTELPATREVSRGVILGYQVNYWLMEGEIATDYKEFIRVEGQTNEGIFIGLESDSFYYAEVRAYNSAGLGPPSEVYLIETKHAPAVAYPEEVRVYSAGHGQVLIWWRGIHILQPEANVHGFVLYFWPANEHYRTACEMIIHDHHAHEAHVTVDKGVIYALRVSAWSEGGYGKKTPTTYFTLEGQVTVDSAFAKEIDVFLASAVVPSLSSLLLCACFTLLTVVI